MTAQSCLPDGVTKAPYRDNSPPEAVRWWAGRSAGALPKRRMAYSFIRGGKTG